jgi:DNA polymerase III epsilon subunit-like protein
VLEALGDGVVVTTDEGRVSLANPAAQRLADPGGPSLLGRDLTELMTDEEFQPLRERLGSGTSAREWVRFRAPGGRILNAVVTRLGSSSGQGPGLVLVLRGGAEPQEIGASSPPEVRNAPGPATQGGRNGPGIAGTQSDGGVGAAPARPPWYDFSWFSAAGRGVGLVDHECPLGELDCVVLDTETTGFDRSGRDRIVSIAGVRVRGGCVRRGEVFDALVNPGRGIPPSSAAFHGITDAMVVDVPPIDSVLPASVRFARDSVLVGHQVWFDLHFLARECERLGLPLLSRTHAILDTRLLATMVDRSLGDLGLDGIAHRLGVPVEGRHSALGDALATGEVFSRLIPLLHLRGIGTLGGALEGSSRLRHVRTA